MAAPSTRLRAGRYLGALLLILVVLYGLVFFSGGSTAPKLGLDLRGGTTVTLTAKTSDEKPPKKNELNTARQIIERRVNGLGVAEAEVVAEGNDRLVISVPGQRSEQAKQLGDTAKLRFRPVLAGPLSVGQANAPTPSPSSTPTPSNQPSSAPSSGATGAPSATPAPQSKPMSFGASSVLAAGPSVTGTATPAASSANGAQVVPAASSAAAPTPAPTPAPSPGATPPPNPAGPPPPPPGISQPDWDKVLKDFEALSCSQKEEVGGSLDAFDKPLASCSEDGKDKYLLAPGLIEGTEIKNASAQLDAQGLNAWMVVLNLRSGGQGVWADYTSKHNAAVTPGDIANRVAFALDGRVVSAPEIQGTINGQTQVTGNFNQDSAEQLANSLKYGSLPLTFTQSAAETVSPTLGTDQLKAGLLAGGIGLALVVVYSLLYYRALGLVTFASLGISGLLTYACLVLLGRSIGFTLTLAGIAGFIVAVGITADSFVVFFERLKDEVREGRSPRSAVPRAWKRARRTILTADAVSFIAAAVLYYLAAGAVKGFAFTLGLSTVLDLVVVFLFTHPLVSAFSRRSSFSSPRFSGLGAIRRVAPAGAGGTATSSTAVTQSRSVSKEETSS